MFKKCCKKILIFNLFDTQEFASMKLEESAKEANTTNSTSTKEKIVQIEEPLHRQLDGITPIQQVLEVVNSLYRISDEAADNNTVLVTSLGQDQDVFFVPNEEFICKKITNKLVQQIQVTENTVSSIGFRSNSHKLKDYQLNSFFDQM